MVNSISHKTRLRCPKGLTEHIRRAREAVCGIPREALSPAGAWLEDHALFLLEEADALKREIKRSPRLPGKTACPGCCAGRGRSAKRARGKSPRR